MTRHIIILFTFAAAIISLIATMIGIFFGAKGVIAYLIFAGLCLTPAVRLTHKTFKENKHLHNNNKRQ